jgi:DNA oxidative demethylase
MGRQAAHAFDQLDYDFTTGQFARTEEIPHWLKPVRDRAAIYADLAADALEQARLIRYDIGAGIGWRRDRPVFEHVVGLSLGTPAVLRFRQSHGDRFNRAKALLKPRRFYHLAGEARRAWEHSIAPDRGAAVVDHDLVAREQPIVDLTEANASLFRE